jgi:hypothetical protein
MNSKHSAKEAYVLWRKMVRNLRDMEQTMLKLLRLKEVPPERSAALVLEYQRVYASIRETQKALQAKYPPQSSWNSIQWEM